MLFTARLTTEVSIWANSTPSEVAIRIRRGCVRSVLPLSHVETRVMAFFPLFTLMLPPDCARSHNSNSKTAVASPGLVREANVVIRPITSSDARCVRPDSRHCRYAFASLLQCSLETGCRRRRSRGPPVFCNTASRSFCCPFDRYGRVKGLTSKVKVRFLLNSAFEVFTHGSSPKEEHVQKISYATMAIIVAVALYFAVVWGYDGLHILSSSSYGLEDVWRSQFIFAIGSLLGLGPIGLIKLAAFFGALKLAVACICVIHIADRFRSLSRGQANSEILEAGLILIVAISIVSVGPASFRDGGELIREHTLPLLLAALATGLCIFERNYAQRIKNAEIKAQ